MKKSTRNFIIFLVFLVGFIAFTYDIFFFEGRKWWLSLFYAVILLVGAWGKYDDYRYQKELEQKKQYYSEK